MHEINAEMKALIKEIEATNVRELQNILSSLQKIAQHYRHLELDSVGFVKEVSSVAKDVCHTAQSALLGGARALTSTEALDFISKDFDGLAENLACIISRHSDISYDLKEQADLAAKAKQENDARAAQAEDMKDKAIASGFCTIPGVALVAFPIAGAKVIAEDFDHPLAKVAAGAGGALLGTICGVAATVVFPLLGIYAIRCAVLYKRWSVTFGDLSEKILKVETSINNSAKQLINIKALFQRLKEKVAKYEQTSSTNEMKHQFERIVRSCNEVIAHCDSYLNSLQSNRHNRFFLAFDKDK